MKTENWTVTGFSETHVGRWPEVRPGKQRRPKLPVAALPSSNLSSAFRIYAALFRSTSLGDRKPTDRASRLKNWPVYGLCNFHTDHDLGRCGSSGIWCSGSMTGISPLWNGARNVWMPPGWHFRWHWPLGQFANKFRDVAWSVPKCPTQTRSYLKINIQSEILYILFKCITITYSASPGTPKPDIYAAISYICIHMM